MTRALESSDVVALWAHMRRHYGTELIDKGDALEMKAVGTLLEQLGVQDRERFLAEYATTLGRRIYLPFTVGEEVGGRSLWSQVVTAAHEHQHVVQHVRDGLAYELGYVVDSSQRARHEAEAYLSNIELHHWRYGVIPTPRPFAEKLASYGCTEQDILWAAKYLTLAAETIRLGGTVTEAGAVVLAWLTEHAPDLGHAAT